MSRFSSAAACALLALAGLTVGHHLGAQQDANPFGLDKSESKSEAATDETASESKSAAIDAADRIEAALHAKLVAPLEFVEVPFREVIYQLQDEYNIPIQFDTVALDEIAISTETEVTASIRNVSLRSALNLMLNTPGLGDLTYIVKDEVLLITTNDRANDVVETVVYRVDDLLDVSSAKEAKDSSKNDRYSYLQYMIIGSIEYHSWQENGTGEGTLFLAKPGMLVVTQTHSVHLKIEEFLDKLRRVKQAIENDNAISSGNNLQSLP